jgi:hypothetical protein
MIVRKRDWEELVHKVDALYRDYVSNLAIPIDNKTLDSKINAIAECLNLVIFKSMVRHIAIKKNWRDS